MSVAAKVREAVERMRARQSCIPANKERRVHEYVPPPAPPDVDYRSALAGIADKAFFLTNRYGEQQWRADRDGAHEDILLFERTFRARLKRLDVPVFAHCVIRGEDEQNAAYKRGVSKARWLESPHNFGMAVDIIHSTKAWDLTERQWAIFGHLGKEVAAALGIPITWGGDFKSLWDPAHWELKDWRAL